MHLARSFILALAGVMTFMEADALSAQAQEGPPAAWRVECTGDGKSLECRAIQQIIRVQGNNRQNLAMVVVRYAPETKAGQMSILLPLGLNLTEPVQIKVDNNPPEKAPIQTCDNGGCLVTLVPNDKFLAAMRTGMDLKITVQDQSKKSIEVAVPLLGFGVAYDKTK